MEVLQGMEQVMFVVKKLKKRNVIRLFVAGAVTGDPGSLVQNVCLRDSHSTKCCVFNTYCISDTQKETHHVDPFRPFRPFRGPFLMHKNVKAHESTNALGSM